MLANFDATADTAYANALIETELCDPAWIGREIGQLMADARAAVNPSLTLGGFKSMRETLEAVASDGQLVGLDLGQAIGRLAAARESGHIGRLTLPWAAWAFEQLGYDLRLTGGLGAAGRAPAWLLTDFAPTQ